MRWFLHGALGLPGDWDPWYVKGDVGVSLYDEVVSFDEWAASFCARVKAVDAAPVLVGYSMGGRLALHALLADPGMWARAVLVSAHTGLAIPEERETRLTNDRVWAEKVRELPWEGFLAEWNAQPVFEGTMGALAGRADLETRRAAVATAFDEWSLGRQDDLLPALGRLDFPVTWVVGERDVRFVSIARTAVENLPQGRLEIVSDAGHRVPWDQPECFRTFVCADFG